MDGNLVGLIPRNPTVSSDSDAGYGPGVTYSIDFAVFPAPSTIVSISGSPLTDAQGYQFTTTPFPTFVEPRRPIHHGLAPSQGGRSDDEGCLQNPDNTLFDGSVQFGSGIGAKLLCLRNQGSPQVILDQCTPTHNQQAVGVPSAVTPGAINLPAIIFAFNEPLDPLTVEPWVPTTKLGLNVQLWRVGDTERVPIPPEPIRTNKPVVNQSLTDAAIILSAANEDEFGIPVGGVPQGTYMLNITPDVTDLPGFPLRIDDLAEPFDRRYEGGDRSEREPVRRGPAGYRYYFVTLKVPGTAQSFNEGFNTNLNEWGDALSSTNEPGVFEETNPGTGDLREPIPSTNVSPAPEFTLLYNATGVGQSTTMNWNGGFRFLGLSSLSVNTDVDTGTGRLKAVYKPWAGTGADGAFDSGGGGANLSLGTDPVPGNSVNGDGISEFTSFNLRAGDFLGVAGSRPLLILCRGDVHLDGTIDLIGHDGAPGLDTDGSTRYTVPGAASPAGTGGMPGAGRRRRRRGRGPASRPELAGHREPRCAPRAGLRRGQRERRRRRRPGDGARAGGRRRRWFRRGRGGGYRRERERRRERRQPDRGRDVLP